MLIQPRRPFEEFTITSVEGNTWTYEQFLGKWTPLYLGKERCDLFCEANLFKMRQIRLALGRDSVRIQRKYLGISEYTDVDSFSEIFGNYPDMQVAWFAPT